MSEVVTEINTSVKDTEKGLYPQGYESLKRIEVKRQKDETEALYGVIEIGGVERQFLMPDMTEMWGYEANTYEDYKKSPEVWDLKQRVSSLEAQVAQLQARLGANGWREEDERLYDPRDERDDTPAGPSAAETTVLEDEPEVRRANVRIRQPIYMRLWNRARDLPAEDEYPVDEIGPYRVNRYGERVYIEYERNDRGKAIAALGAIAAVGALAYGIWNHHELEELERGQPAAQKVTQPSVRDDGLGGGGYSVVPEAKRHNGYYDPSPNHRRTAVGLPGNLKIRYNINSESIVDSRQKVIVRRVTWDRQGNLSRQTKEELRKNYRLSQTTLGDRYKTQVWNK